MAEEFQQTIPLSETTKFIVDNRGKTAPTTTSGIPLIATNCVSNSDLYPTYKNVRFVSQETYKSWFRSHPEPGDILLTNKGSQNGAICLVPDPVDFVIAQDMVALRANEDVIDPLFLFAALRSPNVQHQIRNLDVSGVIPHIKKSDFDKLMLPFPDRRTQRLVGNIYFGICRKIELNRRMNVTLEAMAQAIFRDWFVDFGPTRRKRDGVNDPTEILGGLVPDSARAADLAALFPDALGDDGLPVGWEERPLDQIAEFLNGLALQKFPATGAEDLPVIKIAELRNGITSKSNRASRNVPTKYIIGNGDFLFSWSGSLLAKFWTEGEGALNQHLFKVSSNSFPGWFFSQWVFHHLAEFRRIAASKATTMGHIQRSHLRAAQTVVPDAKAIEPLGLVVGPIVEKTVQNSLENQTLAATRDLLLPRLMSGDIRLGEAEQLAEAAL